MLVDNMLGDNTMSIIQTNFISIAVKDKKMPKWPMSWLPSPLLYSKFSGETVDSASVEKALAMSQPIFKPKSSILSSQGQFLWKDEETDSAGTSFQDF